MKSLKKDTLAFQLGVRPGTQQIDRSGSALVEVVKVCRSYKEKDQLTSPWVSKGSLYYGKQVCVKPEIDALTFYMLNHAVSVVAQKVSPLSPLGDYLPVVEEYHRALSVLSARMFFYLLLICTRESRHVKNESSSSFATKVEELFGTNNKQFLYSIRGSGSGGAVDKLMVSPPTTTLGTYTDMLVHVFYHGLFSGGYGGPAWGKVADVLRDYVHGKLSAEGMMDTAFTLCHNNGPIFNKGMLFHTYGPEIATILDVQRSGQIPQMIGNKETSFHADPVLSHQYQMCFKLLPNEFSGYVDWFKVESLGALKSYPTQKENQVKKYGQPAVVPGVTKPKAKSISSKIVVDMEAIDGYEVFMEEGEIHPTLEVMPGVFVPIVERPVAF